MIFPFTKYQGTGNDFILIDDREEKFPIEATEAVARLCHRRFGIGADGLMLLRNDPEADFLMVYFNSDGRTSSMCGNGGRCIAAFARKLGFGKSDKLSFMAPDGIHHATFEDEKVILDMKEVEGVDHNGSDFVMCTGSPHYVRFLQDINTLDFINEAKAIRYNEEYKQRGINVNFVRLVNDDYIDVRTYERGVEDETYSCGTGVVASAIATACKEDVRPGAYHFNIETLGGHLEVRFDAKGEGRFTNVQLIGPAVEVFEGEVEI